jgi:2-polyprenyl-3-methyl-5-hydroxy-6-metoxy-1,4-benzoquinol methylase
LSDRIADERFIRELEEPFEGSDDDEFASLEQCIERNSRDILSAGAEDNRPGFFRRLLFRLLKPILNPLFDHRRAVERDLLSVIRRTRSMLEQRTDRLHAALLRAYVKTGESLALLRADLLSDVDRRKTDTDAAVQTAAHAALEAETMRIRADVRQEIRDLAADLVARADMMIGHLDERLTSLEHGLRRQAGHTAVKVEEAEAAASRLRAEFESLSRTVGLVRNAVTIADVSPDAAQTEIGIDDEAYYAHQDSFRGDRGTILHRMEIYLECFRDAAPVLDVGCGRGEFLEVLKDAGVEARGLDASSSMVAICRELGLDVEQARLPECLEQLKDGSLGGLFASHVIEHLPFVSILAILRETRRVLRPGGVCIVETINPESLYAFSRFYLLDPTHVTPLPPSLLAFAAEQAGFSSVDIVPVNEAPREQRLDAVDLETAAPAAIEDAFRRLNGDIERLNELIFGTYDYAVVARP